MRLPPASVSTQSVAGTDGVVAESAGGGIVWSGSIHVAGADGLRLHLEDVQMPENAVLWVWGAGEEPRAFGRELLDEVASIWTPAV